MNAPAPIQRLNGREIADLARSIREACGEDDTAFVDTLDGATDAVEAARAVVRWMNEQEAQEAAMAELSKLYAARSKVFEGRAASGRRALLTFMQEIGEKSLKLPEATLSVRAGQAQLIGDPHPEDVPDEFCRFQRYLDRSKIKDHLLNGGCVLGFALSNGAPSLTIRRA